MAVAAALGLCDEPGASGIAAGLLFEGQIPLSRLMTAGGAEDSDLTGLSLWDHNQTH